MHFKMYRSVIILIIVLIIIWWFVTSCIETYMENDPVILHLKHKLLPFFPRLKEIKIMKSDSSYTINKRKIYICTEYDGHYYDDNMLIYVILHELAHVETPEIGHGKTFLEKFSQLLKIAETNGLWDPSKPRTENYCKSSD